MALGNSRLIGQSGQDVFSGVNTLNLAGTPGYGVGIYPGSNADLQSALGLVPMDGYDDPESDNYGNYIHEENESVFVFIPKFYYRFISDEEVDATDTETLTEVAEITGYTVDQLLLIKERSPYNAFVITNAFANEKEANKYNFALHRAFIDGGVEQPGFFIMKYLASVSGYSIKNSIPNGYRSNNWVYGVTGINNSKSLFNDYFNTSSTFMWSAIAMFSKFESTVVTSDEYCAWYNEELLYSHPKGFNSYVSSSNCTNIYDTTVKFTYYTTNTYVSIYTGSGDPFNKTTHNGQNCGVTDVAGHKIDLTLGVRWHYSATSTRCALLNSDYKLSDVTTSNMNSAGTTTGTDLWISLYGTSGITTTSGKLNSDATGISCYFKDLTGTYRDICGILFPTGCTASSTEAPEFGGGYHGLNSSNTSWYGIGHGYHYTVGSSASVYTFDSFYYTGSSNSTYGYRTGVYMPDD